MSSFSPTSDSAQGCCVSRGEADSLEAVSGARPAIAQRDGEPYLTAIPGGVFEMGTDRPLYPQDGEGPARQVTVSEFRLAARPVTNHEFASFVEETGYRTDAERIGWSFVFEGMNPPPDAVVGRSAGASWWLGVTGAAWRSPKGPGSSLDDLGHHPVVHVSWFDAVAYCQWVGGRLPTEAEWEHAAKAGSEATYPWGEELAPGGRHMCNIWQGKFPVLDTGEDGHRGTSPVGSFPPNGFGIYDMIGNVWEWCSDWYSSRVIPSGTNPTGPSEGAGKVTKGGSFLCHRSYCARYRPAARTSNTPDSSTSHLGFRVAAAPL